MCSVWKTMVDYEAIPNSTFNLVKFCLFVPVVHV